MSHQPSIGRFASAFGGALPTAEQVARPTTGVRLRRLVALALALVGVGAATGCVAPGADVHLAPFYTRATPPGGATEHEALGGLVHGRRDPSADRWQSFAVRPLFGWRRGWADRADAEGPRRDWEPQGPDDLRVDWLVPLGFFKTHGDEVRSVFAPVYYWRSADAIRSGQREWDLLALPLIYLSRNDRGANKTAWFPFYGQLDKFLTFDRVRFALFPLWISAARRDFTHQNVLFPVFGWTWNHADGERRRRHLRVWPLFSYHAAPGRWVKGFFLWPIFHRHLAGLDGPPEQRSSKWAALPLFGWTRHHSYRSVAFLWPFFGYAWDTRGAEPAPGAPPDAEAPGAFWAWDGPWPFVRVQGGGRDPLAEERQRFWPFYSYFESNDLVWRTYAWPFVHDREETGPDFRRASFYVLPFYRGWQTMRDEPGYLRGPEREDYAHLWPIVESERAGDWRRDAVLALWPFGKSALIRHYWGWLWELYATERQGDVVRSRSWLGLYRFATDGDERRHSLAGLWSSRAWGAGASEVVERSVLFGLIRWRSGPGAADRGVMRPAFPGPGWPQEWTTEGDPVGSPRVP